MYVTKNNYLSLVQLIILGLMFFAGMNFLQKSFYFIYAAFFITVLYNYRKFIVDLSAAILILFSFSYLFFYPEARMNFMQILRQFAYFMCYLIGMNFMDNRNLMQEERKKREVALAIPIVFVGMGPFLHYVLNMTINIGSTSRNTVDIWTKEAMSATGQAMMAVIAMGIFTSLIFTAGSQKMRIVAIVGLALIMAYNMVLAGRTLLIVLFVTIVVAFLYTRKNKKGINWKNVFLIVAIVCLIVLVYTNDIFGTRTSILNSNLLIRFNKLGEGYFMDATRIGVKFEYLKMAPQYLFGGGKIRESIKYYAHDIYLDTYNEAGIIGWGFLALFVVCSAVQLARGLKRNVWSIKFKTMLLCVFICINIVFFVEPILSGMPWMLCIFCFYQGIINRENFVMKGKT
ncbi:MAG: hypothetical protein J6C34_05090 [Oscillospiraceae bacterium]|nr:hypothetical protein [Oscillospiraceae bacterium]MBQ8594531.1 hypothetical protein [Oscillospiraceae bacterium]